MNSKRKILFEPARSEFSKTKGDLVDSVLKAVAKIGGGYHIVVEGHSDDEPYGIANNENWELSSERAIAILRKLTSMGVKEQRISMSAYAHTRPKINYVGLKGKALMDARRENRRVGVWLKMPNSTSQIKWTNTPLFIVLKSIQNLESKSLFLGCFLKCFHRLRLLLCK